MTTPNVLEAVMPSAEALRFARNLKRLREAAGLTQRELAAACGISPRTLSHWEQANAEPPFSQVVLLAAALGCGLEEFTRDAPAETGGEDLPGPGRPRKKS